MPDRCIYEKQHSFGKAASVSSSHLFTPEYLYAFSFHFCSSRAPARCFRRCFFFCRLRLPSSLSFVRQPLRQLHEVCVDAFFCKHAARFSDTQACKCVRCQFRCRTQVNRVFVRSGAATPVEPAVRFLSPRMPHFTGRTDNIRRADRAERWCAGCGGGRGSPTEATPPLTTRSNVLFNESYRQRHHRASRIPLHVLRLLLSAFRCRALRRMNAMSVSQLMPQVCCERVVAVVASYRVREMFSRFFFL